jgi:hypothetical protein
MIPRIGLVDDEVDNGRPDAAEARPEPTVSELERALVDAVRMGLADLAAAGV